MDKERLQSIIDRIYDLPTLPIVVNKLIEVVGNPYSCANDIAKIISTDQALTSKILKIVNSSFYGFRTPIGTVSLAVVILGYKSLRSLALSVSVFDMFEEKEGGALNLKQLWEHSLAVALCARIISNNTKIGVAEEQFVCGLLHDIGEILFYRYAYEELQDVVSLVTQDKTYSLLEAEKKILGPDHTEIGHWLAEKWRLPQVVREAIHKHHDFSSIKNISDEDLRTQVAMIYFADTFCKAKGFRYGGEKKTVALEPEVYTLLGLSQKDDPSLSQEIDTEIKKAETYLKMQGSKGISIENDPGESQKS